MIKLAKIIDINSVNVTLKLQQDSQCSGCTGQCKDGFMNFLFNKPDKGTLIVALDGKNIDKYHLVDKGLFFTDKYKANDVIGLKFCESDLFKLSLLLYGLPIILIVLTLISGYFIFPYLNFNADIGGVFGLIVGLFLSRKIIKLNDHKLKPQVKFFK